MDARPRIRPRIGDVVEIPVAGGFAYAHYSHRHSRYGALLRVLKGIFDERPDDMSQIVDREYQFTTFFPLSAACREGIVTIVVNEDLPERAKEFPTFRARAVGLNGAKGPWWLWDGENEWQIGSLEAGMESLPIRGVWNDTLLVSRIESGWSHEHDT